MNSRIHSRRKRQMNADPKFRPVPLSYDGGDKRAFSMRFCQTCASCDATGLIFVSFSESQCPPPPPSLLSLPGVSNSRRLRQRRLGAAVSRPASDDVLHEHGQSHTHRAAAPQPAALPQEAAAPNHLHRRTAGGFGGPLPGDQVPRRRNPRTTGPQGPSAGGESGGEFLFSF